MSDDNSVLVKIKPTRFEHDVIIYIPVFQKNFDDDGQPLHYPTFVYSLADGSDDEQMAWSAKPDYVLELKGRFDATTKSFIVGDKKE